MHQMMMLKLVQVMLVVQKLLMLKVNLFHKLMTAVRQEQLTIKNL